jgi:hypothetical protein
VYASRFAKLSYVPTINLMNWPLKFIAYSNLIFSYSNYWFFCVYRNWRASVDRWRKCWQESERQIKIGTCPINLVTIIQYNDLSRYFFACSPFFFDKLSILINVHSINFSFFPLKKSNVKMLDGIIYFFVQSMTCLMTRGIKYCSPEFKVV